MSDYSEHNEKFDEYFQQELDYLTNCLHEEYNCSWDILRSLQSVVQMSYEKGVYSVHNQNGWNYKMEYPE